MIFNRYDFTNLMEYVFKCEIKVDGKKVWEKEFSIDIVPKGTARIQIPLPHNCRLGAFVNCYLYDRTGYSVAQKQLELPCQIKDEQSFAEPAEVFEDKNWIVFKGKKFSYGFFKPLGHFASLVKNGEEQLCAPICLTSFRAPIDNERNKKGEWYWGSPWGAENLDRQFEKVYSVSLCRNELTVIGSLAGVSRLPYFRYTVKYIIFADGTIKVILDGTIKESCPWLPRLGFEFKVPKSKSEFRFFGMGPYESYCDMNHASMIDWYKSDAVSEYVNYVMPQEHGNHIKTKVLEMKDGLTFESENMDINVSCYSGKSLMYAQHQDELAKSDCTNIRIDYKNSGIGSASCGTVLLEKYRLSEKDIHFEFYIR